MNPIQAKHGRTPREPSTLTVWAGSWGRWLDVKKLLVGGFTSKIACPARSFRVLVHPSGVDVHLGPALPSHSAADQPPSRAPGGAGCPSTGKRSCSSPTCARDTLTPTSPPVSGSAHTQTRAPVERAIGSRASRDAAAGRAAPLDSRPGITSALPVLAVRPFSPSDPVGLRRTHPVLVPERAPVPRRDPAGCRRLPSESGAVGVPPFALIGARSTRTPSASVDTAVPLRITVVESAGAGAAAPVARPGLLRALPLRRHYIVLATFPRPEKALP